MNSASPGIILLPQHWAQMEADVAARLGEEACGLLAGQGHHCQIVIPVTNSLHDPYRFRMDPREELEAFLLIEQKGWEVIGIYHSHPQGISQPSPTDQAELIFPGIIYLIWYQQAGAWYCRGYMMQLQHSPVEVPVIVSHEK